MMPTAPIDMLLYCPACGQQHIDAPARDSHAPCGYCLSPPAAPCYASCTMWTNPPHRSHLCAGCGHIWRPADVPTNGVAAIQTAGKNDSPKVKPYASGDGDEIQLMFGKTLRKDPDDAWQLVDAEGSPVRYLSVFECGFVEAALAHARRGRL